MNTPADTSLLAITQSLAEMAVLPLDKSHAACTECTADTQCWHHRQFQREVVL